MPSSLPGSTTRLGATVIPGILETGDDAATAIWPVAETGYPAWLENRSEQQRAWLEAAAFKPDEGKFVLLPDADGAFAGVVLGSKAIVVMAPQIQAVVASEHQRVVILGPEPVG